MQKRWQEEEDGGEEKNREEEDSGAEENGEGENGRAEENREELLCDREMTPNLVASALKPRSCSTSLHVIKYLAMKMTCIFFHCSKKMNIKC